MIERRPVLDVISHAVLIAGALIIAFPLYVAFIASTHSLEDVMRMPMSLLPGEHLIENYYQVLTAGSTKGSKAAVFDMLINSTVMALVVPVGKKIRMLTTAADVIHSWWVPAFGAKQDAIPGFIRDLWFRAEKTGTFRSQCVELCGKEHGFMPIVVKVVTQEEYSKWAGDQLKLIAAAADDPNKTYTLDELKKRGESVYAKNCTVCHQATGKGTPPAFPPLDGSTVVTGPKDAQIQTLLKGVVKDGKSTAMVAFGPQLNDFELAAVITFTRNNWGNKTGEAIQPAEVKSLRK